LLRSSSLWAANIPENTYVPSRSPSNSRVERLSRSPVEIPMLVPDSVGLDRQLAQQQGIDEAENRGVRPNSQGQRENRDRGECRALGQHAGAISEILPDFLHKKVLLTVYSLQDVRDSKRLAVFAEHPLIRETRSPSNDAAARRETRLGGKPLLHRNRTSAALLSQSVRRRAQDHGHFNASRRPERSRRGRQISEQLALRFLHQDKFGGEIRAFGG
jgi:hypothetical protein